MHSLNIYCSIFQHLKLYKYVFTNEQESEFVKLVLPLQESQNNLKLSEAKDYEGYQAEQNEIKLKLEAEKLEEEKRLAAERIACITFI